MPDEEQPSSQTQETSVSCEQCGAPIAEDGIAIDEVLCCSPACAQEYGDASIENYKDKIASIQSVLADLPEEEEEDDELNEEVPESGPSGSEQTQKQ